MTIIAAADGSALGNPGPMGWAWYIDDDSWAAGGAAHGTNNQGELTAVLELLRATAHTGESLLVHCDSKYVIDSITKWMPGWKRKGWRKADGKPVMNREIMEALDAELADRDVVFEWVKGHAGHSLNEAADARANAAAQAFQRRVPVDAGPGLAPAPGPRRRSTHREPAPDGDATTVPAAAGDAEPSPASDAGSPGPRRGRGARVSLRDHAAGGAVGIAQPTLFDDLPEPEVVEQGIRLVLTPRERARLRARADEAGLTPEEFLRGLI